MCGPSPSTSIERPGNVHLSYDDETAITVAIAPKYRLVQKKDTVLLSTSLAWPAVAGCSRAETFSQLSAISFAQPCIKFHLERNLVRKKEKFFYNPSK